MMNRLSLNNNWKFLLNEEPNGIHLENYDETNLRTLNIPHDWSVEFSFDEEEGIACTGFLLGGIGWYRKHITTTKEMLRGRTIIHFDGIYNRSTIYCNGQVVTFHPSGYAPLLVDITDYLNPLGEDNVIAVKADHSRHADSRWYTGSGIYRDVWLHVLPEVHIPVWGTFITTPEVDENSATVNSQFSIANTTDKESSIEIDINLLDPNDNLAVSKHLSKTIPPNTSEDITAQLKVNTPTLWNIHSGQLYKQVITITKDSSVIQEVTTKFGIRTFKFDPDKGFFINGKNELIKGVCLHHDGGLVGAAVPLDVWRRRLETLVDGGCNAIRTAHNPASEEFLDLCDDMGLLVQEEFFDEWHNPKDKRQNGNEKFVDHLSRGHAEFFRDYAKSDLQDTMLRDRNHPSIIQWSIGNEIELTYTKFNDATGYLGVGTDSDGSYFWSIPPISRDEIASNMSLIPKDFYDIDTTAKQLSDWTKELDTTRPVTANCILPTASYETGYCDALDLVGYSYRRVIYNYGHEHFGNKPIMGTENVAQWHEWKAVLEHEHIPGTFLWTGVDHIGEAQAQGTPYPRKNSNVGILDLAGFPKPAYYMYRSLWLDTPELHMVTQSLKDSLYKLNHQGQLVERIQDGWQRRLWFWHEVNPHFNYQIGESVVVEAYSNCESITLYHNNQDMGKLYLKDFEDHIYKWLVPFAKGELKVVGHYKGEEIIEVLNTSETPTKAILACDKESLSASNSSCSHITVQLFDNNFHPVTHQELKINFDISGPAKVLGVDNGHPDNVNDFQSTSITTNNGHALLILQGNNPGTINVNAYCDDHAITCQPVIIEVNE